MSLEARVVPLPVPKRLPDKLSRFAVAYLAGALGAFVVAVLFGVAVHVELLSPKPSLMSGAAFGQLQLLRAALLAFGIALPAVVGLGHLALPPSASLAGAAKLIVTLLDGLAALLFGLTAVALLGACVTAEWSSLVALAVTGALATTAAAVQSLSFLIRLRAEDKSPVAANLASAVWLTSGVGLVVFPVCALLLSLLVAEHLAHIVGWHDAGGNAQRYAYWLRLVTTGVPYFALVPCVGAVSDVLGSRPSALLGPFAAIALFIAAAWSAQTLGSGGAGAIAVASFFSLALLVPATLVATEWLAALRQQTTYRTQPWLGVVALLLFFELAMTGTALSMADVGRVLRGGTFVAAHADLLLASIGFAVAAAVDQRLAAAGSLRLVLVGSLITLTGVNVAIGSEALAGVHGMPLTIDYAASLQTLSTVASVGWFVTALGTGILAAHFFVASRRSRTS